MVQTRIEEKLEAFEQEMIGMKKELSKILAIEENPRSLTKSIERLRIQAEENQKLFLKCAETLVKKNRQEELNYGRLLASKSKIVEDRQELPTRPETKNRVKKKLLFEEAEIDWLRWRRKTSELVWFRWKRRRQQSSRCKGKRKRRQVTIDDGPRR
ncbi:histone-lysine N-methyltransferase ASHR1 isoform X3 [Cucumis melo var. makuwa]|uniref:Histone-lysine N-methyltransferase ASHR1 isoform X3 n=2 Tax=Cucumis melo TaxID=3656 RepID=A0A5D3BML1_CUCMM|nr:histone-lysine N-methyltransferase ASHR1 isoform X3 [Cucumis melo var. makuwa]